MIIAYWRVLRKKKRDLPILVSHLGNPSIERRYQHKQEKYHALSRRSR
jgi:hypothetical protein